MYSNTLSPTQSIHSKSIFFHHKIIPTPSKKLNFIKVSLGSSEFISKKEVICHGTRK